MWQFIKYVFATIVGLFLFSLLGFFLFIGLAAALGSSEEKTTVEKNSVLKLNLNSSIQEVSVENPFAEFTGGQGEVIGLLDIKSALANAKLDPNIAGVYLDVQYPMVGWASAEEIRDAIIDFKKSKKFVYAYGEVMTEKAYYLASVADKIYLNPAGGMEWNGLSAEYDFYKGTLDKLEVKPLVFRVGEYKSAVEPFFRENMSDASKLQNQVLINTIFGHAVENIAKSRNIPAAQLKNLADSLSIDSPQDALKHKFITHIGYYDEVETSLKNELKLKEDDKIKFVTLGKYTKADKLVKEGPSDRRIAVIVGEGAIMSGKSNDGNIGSETIMEELRKARKDKKVKAVVLRINSPGGSALASDVMWREVQLTRKEKPVIASMSDVAASGGYYMAMGCDKIVAQPNTITGSIGVFSVLFNFEDTFRNKLGITFDRVNTNAHSDWPSVTRDMTPFENNRLQKSTENIYAIFTRKAAEGRKMPLAKLQALASGRVWSGKEAKANGLIDEFGGLDKAIQVAAQAAKLKEGDYRIKYPAEKNMFEQFINKLSGNAEEQLMQQKLGDFAPYLKVVKKLQQMQGTQARLPYDIVIK
ncbi:signal peptide peptidase SppA [Runella slithyformis]|uniref:Signal peptide peptidase SppA, 67K type n=1 Tax=Runella slithyformis (strain ATCC 29530 / DSM 19594 / LMG 11500 / NCIMB 11436 / LSU 4) TaxID=761193 RepID=A0A7U3ZQG0_RUNSL|nr:signal peptide peptidase SppA [Runella slithyformis]AEI51487.1 signal peptide peptidase SppA, 67K type [Runella slithyformis DSM 19594]